jgi:cytoskeleton protein RodZ
MNDGLQPATTAVDGVGAVLHAERRRQNLSLGDVSRHLKLSVRQVEALERDDFSPFGGAVFVHGFIRNYSKLLGLEAEPLIQAADAKMMPAEPVMPERQQMAGEEGQPRRQNYAAAGLLAFVLIAGGVGFYAHKTNAPESLDESSVSAPDAPLAEGPARESEVPAAAATPAATPEVRAPAAREPLAENGNVGVLRMIFDQESWVEVTDR